MVAQGRQRDFARVQELEGKYLYPSIVGFFKINFLSLAIIRAEVQAYRGGCRASVGAGGPEDRTTQAL
jgi:hypothetical protein